MYEVSIVDNKLSLKHSISYSLSIQLGLNGLSFSVFNPYKKFILGLKHHPFEEKALDHDDLTNKVLSYIHQEKILQRRFKFVSVMYQSPKNTIIPKHYFKIENLKNILEMNHPLNELDELHYNELKFIDGYNVFALPNYIGNEFTSRYKRIHFQHHATCMIKDAIRRDEKLHENALFINVNSGFFDVLVIKDKKVYLYNTFKFRSPDDLVYYVISVFKQIRIVPEHTDVFYSGFISEGSTELYLLRKYLGNIQPCPPNEELIFSKKFNKFPLHYFTNLFNLHLCAS